MPITILLGSLFMLVIDTFYPGHYVHRNTFKYSYADWGACLCPGYYGNKDGVYEYSCANLGFTYPNGKKVFEHINFEITQGKILSILGPNGAGKSTLLGCIAGLNPPSRGDILLNGKSIHRMQQREIACMVGFVPQNITPSFNYSVLDYVVTGCAPRMGVFQKPKAAEYEVAWQAICTMGLNISHNNPS